ncbi:hypothetical protein R80B4_02452 [Fibrobacteres bacterium R8-0-B4]
MFWANRGEAGVRTVDFLVKKAEQIEGVAVEEIRTERKQRIGSW